MAAFRLTPDYKLWLEASAENRKKLKEKYRRAAGAKSRTEIKHQALQNQAVKKAEEERAKTEKALATLEFVGPPKPSRKLLGESGYFRWRYMNDADFHMRELDRAQEYKARTRIGYKDSIVKWQNTPTALKELKHLQYLLTKAIERKQDENDQRIEK